MSKTRAFVAASLTKSFAALNSHNDRRFSLAPLQRVSGVDSMIAPRPKQQLVHSTDLWVSNVTPLKALVCCTDVVKRTKDDDLAQSGNDHHGR